MGNPIQPQPGSANDPKDFVGRTTTDERASRYLNTGQNLLLSDPRRMGKTYWMSHFGIVTTDFRPIHVNYEGTQTTTEFLLRTVEALRTSSSLPQQVRRILAGFFEHFDGAEVGIPGVVSIKVGARPLGPTGLLTEVVKTLGQSSGKPWLIFMDEVPMAVHNIAVNTDSEEVKKGHAGPQAAGTLLQTLRRLRTDVPSVRWVVAGSIGFHHVLHEADSTEGVLNDLTDLPFGPLDDADAAELAQRLLAGINRSPELDTVETMTACTGGIAYFIHALAQQIQDGGKTGPLTAEEVAKTWQSYIGNRDTGGPATHLLSRVDDYYGGDAELALEMLDALASGPKTTRDLRADFGGKEHFVTVLDLLIRDHYLAQQDGLVAWRYEVLRRIWAQRRFLDDAS